MCRGIFSHALYAEGSDLRHSSGNLCPNSCGLIRLCMDLGDNAIPGITRGSNPLHTSNQLRVYIYAHAIHFLCAFVRLSTCVTVSVFLLSQHACSCLTPSVCAFVCARLCAHSRVLVCKGFGDGFAFSSLMAGRLSWGFMHRKAMV